MAAISDLSDLINRCTGGSGGSPETIWLHKVPRTGGVAVAAPLAGRMHSLWAFDGTYGGANWPTTEAVPDNTTPGAIPFTNPALGKQKWLIQANATGFQAGTLILYKRLYHIGNLAGGTAGDQTVQGANPTTPIKVNTGGVGNFAFYEVHATLSATVRTITMTYTNQAGVSGQTGSVTFGSNGFREVNRAQIIPIANGDTGIQAIEKINLDGASAGTFGIVIAQPVCYIPISVAGISGFRDFTTGLPGLPEIESGVCLAWLWVASTTTAAEITAGLSFIEK